ncbi:hypothetical protein CDPAHKCJ_00413 [Cobetia sp. MB87]|nr:hypothetical protein [Cobetia sp. MB87]
MSHSRMAGRVATCRITCLPGLNRLLKAAS